MTRPTTTLAESLRRVLSAARSEIHTAIPGIVRSYDAATQTADVEPGVLLPLPALSEESEDGRERLPILPSVPVAWPRAGGFFLHFPLSAGDTVLLVFCESDTGSFRGSGDVSDPGTPERHGLSGAVAIPGYVTRPDPEASADGSHGRVGRSGGPFVEFRSGEIRAGGSEDLALAAALDAIYTAIANAVPGSSDGGAALASSIQALLDADPRWVGRATSVLKGA